MFMAFHSTPERRRILIAVALSLLVLGVAAGAFAAG
jgi:hypothetical protein